MSGYTFEQIPKLKDTLAEGDVQSAIDLVPVVDIEDDEYEYVALLGEIQSLFLSFYKAGNQLALRTTIELIAQSDNLYFTSEWPQFMDLISNAVGVIAEMDKGEEREKLLNGVIGKLSLKDPYVANDHNLNFNLACYYATNENMKPMMEYVRRSRFSFEPEKFINDASFEKYKNEPFFLDALNNIGYTMSSWWTCAWPVEEWCEET